jgi:hypothetical protein
MASRYSLLSSHSSVERSSVRAFERITCAASSWEIPAMSVSHTNASMVASLLQFFAHRLRVVRRVQAHVLLVFFLPTGTCHHQALHGRHQQLRVVTVGAFDRYREGYARSIGEHATFRARLGPIGGVLACSVFAYPELLTKVVEERELYPSYALVAPKLTKGGKAPSCKVVPHKGCDRLHLASGHPGQDL